MENLMPLNKRKEFNLFDAALASLLFIIFNYIFSITYTITYYAMGEPTWVTYIGQFLVEAVFALVSVVIAKARKVELFEASGVKKRVSGRLVWFCFLVAVVAIYLFSHITSVFLDFLSLCGYKSEAQAIIVDSIWKFLLFSVILCVVPAFAEEFLFRGTILSGLKKTGKWTALIVSSLIFSFMHGTPDQTVHQFIIGLLVGYLFLKTGNLWISVIVHFFNNFITIVQSFIVTLIYGTEGVAEEVVESGINPWLGLAIDLLVAVIFAYVGYLCFRYLKTKIIEENERVNGKIEEPANVTISVDGKEQDVTLEVDGVPVQENAETNVEAVETLKKVKEPVSVGTIILFALAGVWLLYDWMSVLLSGFGLF